MRVVDLADELGLTTVATLDLCDRAGVAAESAADELTDDQAAAVRTAASTPPPPPAAGAPLPPPPPVPGAAMPPPGYGAPGYGPQPGYGAPPGYGPQPGYAPPPWAAPRPAPGSSPLKIVAIVLGVLFGIAFLCIIAITFLGTSASSRFDTVAMSIDSSDNESPFDELDSLNEFGNLGLGECFQLPSGDTVLRVEERPCSSLHDAEVYAIQEHPAPADDPYPAAAELEAFALDACQGPFEEFVGRPYESSVLDIYFLYPLELRWTLIDDRMIICAAYDPSGEEIEGTLEGANH